MGGTGNIVNGKCFEELTFKRPPYWNRVAWDYAMEASKTRKPLQPIPHPLVLGGLLDTPEKIKTVAKLPDLPRIEEAIVIPPEYETLSGCPQGPNLFKMPINSVDGRDVVSVCILDNWEFGKIIDYAKVDYVLIWVDGEELEARMAVTERRGRIALSAQRDD